MVSGTCRITPYPLKLEVNTHRMAGHRKQERIIRHQDSKNKKKNKLSTNFEFKQGKK